MAGTVSFISLVFLFMIEHVHIHDREMGRESCTLHTAWSPQDPLPPGSWAPTHVLSVF